MKLLYSILGYTILKLKVYDQKDSLIIRRKLDDLLPQVYDHSFKVRSRSFQNKDQGYFKSRLGSYPNQRQGRFFFSSPRDGKSRQVRYGSIYLNLNQASTDGLSFICPPIHLRPHFYNSNGSSSEYVHEMDGPSVRPFTFHKLS